MAAPSAYCLTARSGPDPKTSPDAVEAASSDKEFASNDPAIKATRPTVHEIIVGY
jgi:hypothetical protein